MPCWRRRRKWVGSYHYGYLCKQARYYRNCKSDSRRCEVVYGDSGYLGVQKRSEIQQNEHFPKVDFRINRRPKSLPKVSDHAIDWERHIEHRKSSIRSKVEHVFRIIKCQFGYKKSRLSRIKEKRKSFVCPVCLCQFVFAGDCRLKTFHNINQEGSLPFYRKENS